jgi:hypothetical protein
MNFSYAKVVEIPMESAILRQERGPSCLSPNNTVAAFRFSLEVIMESSLSSGPLLYILIAWGLVTTVFMLLLIRRSVLSSHEDDQIFLDASEAHIAREQQELVAKINTLSRPILTSGIVSGLLLLALAGLWLYNGLKNF